MTYTIQIRPRRQTTLPLELLQQLDVGVGDRLQIEVSRGKAFIKPQKQAALDAFKEIQQAFAGKNIRESELQQAVIKQRSSKA